MMRGDNKEGHRTRKRTIFWRFFGSFLILCMMPVIAAIAVNYTYVLNIVESGMEDSNTRLLGGFSRSIDVFLGSLEENALGILSHPSVNYFLSELVQSDSSLLVNSFERMEAYQDLSRQLVSLSDLNDIVDNAYLWFLDSDFIVSPSGSYRGDLFHSFENFRPEMGRTEFRQLVETRNLMDFLPTMEVQKRSYPDLGLISSENMATYVVGYPFLSDPEVVLFINLKEESLRHLITVPGQNEVHTFILNREGRTISRSHEDDVLDPAAAERIVRDLDRGSSDLIDISGRAMQVAHVRSRVNDWSFVSLVSLEELRRPALMIRNLSLLFFLFFAVLGGAASWAMSRLMYQPIRKITASLLQHWSGREAGPVPNTGNEYDLIQVWFEAMIDEKVELEQQLREVQPLLQETIVMKLVQGQFSDYDRRIGLPGPFEAWFPIDRHMVVVCVELFFFQQYRKIITESDRNLMVANIKLSIRRALGQDVLFAELRKNLIVCIVDFDEEQRGAPPGIVKIREILEKRREVLKAVITAGSGVETAAEVPASFSRAQELLRERHLTPGIELIVSDAGSGEPPVDAYLTRNEVEKIRNILATADPVRLQEEIGTLLGQHIEQDVPARYVFEMAHDILHTIVRFLDQQNPDDELLETFGSFSPLINLCVDERELAELFENICRELFHAEERESDQQDMFREVKSHIRKHYREELSLDAFARTYHMSQGYFSRRFKEMVGEKYVHFVNRVRIEKAKELLEKTELKVEEIASEVGLGSKNFIVIFRKHEGITPGRYRLIRKASHIG